MAGGVQVIGVLASSILGRGRRPPGDDEGDAEAQPEEAGAVMAQQAMRTGQGDPRVGVWPMALHTPGRGVRDRTPGRGKQEDIAAFTAAVPDTRRRPSRATPEHSGSSHHRRLVAAPSSTWWWPPRPKLRPGADGVAPGGAVGDRWVPWEELGCYRGVVEAVTRDVR